MSVVNALERFRIAFAGRPLLLWCVTLAMLWVVSRATVGGGRRAFPASLLTLVSIAALAAYASIAVWYGFDPHFLDNAEPTMPAIGWLFITGKPIYHDLLSPERYAHVYGPAAFMLQGLALRTLGASIAAAKLVGVGAGLLSLVALFAATRRIAGARAALTATGLSALALLMFRHYSFWTRPDPWLVLGAALLVFVVSRSTGTIAAVAIGILSGVLWDLKITGPGYALPAFGMLLVSGGVRRVTVAAGVGAAVAAAPFVLLSNVSWTNYLTWIRLSGDTGLLMSLLRQNVEWAIFLGLPLLAVATLRAGAISAADRAALVGLVAGMCGVIIGGAKPGAGPYHLMPFTPWIAFLTVRIGLSRATVGTAAPRDTATAAFVLALTLVSSANQALLVRTMRDRRDVADGQDVLRFADSHAGSVAIGYGETEALSFARPLLVFRGGSYFDQPAVREHQLAGLEIPAASAQALNECRVRYWLVPKGERPFAGRNAYAAVFGRPLYSSEFLDSFQRNYRKTTATDYFDVWECRTAGGATR